MPGLTNYTAAQVLNWTTGQLAFNALPSLWMALFITSPQDDGTGGTEVTGLAYVRRQVAGGVATNATTASGNATLNFAAVPDWVQPGMSVRNVTAPTTVAASTVVVSKTSTTVVMSNNAAGAGVGNGDTIRFSAFLPPTNAVGTEPDTLPANSTNGSIVTFAEAGTGGWGTVTAFGIYDAVTVGNLVAFDYLGNFTWEPFTCTLASPGVLTSAAHGYTNGQFVAVTEKYGGSLPVTGGAWAGIKTVANVTTDTFTVGVNTTSTGEGLVRRLTQQSIPENITASFAATTLTVTSA